MITELITRVKGYVDTYTADKRDLYPFANVLKDLQDFYKQEAGTEARTGCRSCRGNSNREFLSMINFAVANVGKYYIE